MFLTSSVDSATKYCNKKQDIFSDNNNNDNDNNDDNNNKNNNKFRLNM